MSFDEFENDARTPSKYVLVFDTETTNDAAQNLIIGTYQVYFHQTLKERGVFYDPVTIKNRNSGELKTLQPYIERHNKKQANEKEKLRLLTVQDFIEEVFYTYGYDFRGTIIGFNLAFDISRLAIGHKRLTKAVELFRGGFSFQLSEKYYRPRIQIKHVSSKLSFFQFSDKPGNAVKRQEGQKVPIRRGFFTDVRTLAVALTAKPYTLKSLAITLKTATRKAHVDTYGDILSKKDIAYALQDTQATWECYQKLLELYKQHGLRTLPHKIYSEASLGKAYLREMGIQSWQKQQRDFNKGLIGIIMSTYYGGRAEVHIRRQISQVTYCDFRSMYPTVCTLMRLWDFVVAQGMNYKETTQETIDFLENVSLEILQNPDIWPRLCVLVQIKPEKDIFPVRAQYGHDDVFTIGLNYLTTDGPIWFTLADCIASKLLTGKTSKILKAISFEPKEKQTGLRPVNIMGNAEYRVDPREGSFFARLIDLRTKIKNRGEDAPHGKKSDFKNQEQALKILANATSYGIFVELVDIKGNEKMEILCYGHTGEMFFTTAEKYEKPGTYFHPLLGTLITGAARLLLAMAEKQGRDAGLDWVLCDTDSMAFAKPEGMENTEFYKRVNKICSEFAPLSPYEKKPSLLKIEDDNFSQDKKGGVIKNAYQPLFCLAISAKRYALFNIDSDNNPQIRKVSAHGLGHLRDPYLSNKINAAEETFDPQGQDEQETAEMSKVKPWHKDFWYCIVDAALNGNMDKPNYRGIKGLHKHAASIFTASTPEHEDWFKIYNKGKEGYSQVRPFNFMLVFKENPIPEIQDERTSAEKRKSKASTILPVAPFDRDLSVAVKRCFDRQTGSSINPNQLATYIIDRSHYHIHPETKFHNGDYLDRGITRRRHIRPTATVKSPAIQPIGKEANQLEEQIILGSNADKQKKYSNPSKQIQITLEIIQQAVKVYGLRKLARAASMSFQQLDKINKGKSKYIQKGTLDVLHTAILNLDQKYLDEKKLLLMIHDEIGKIGTAELSRRIKYDRSNIRRAINQCLSDRLPKNFLNDKIKQKLIIYFADRL